MSIFSLLIGLLQAQNLDQTFQIAQHNQALGSYSAAIDLYQRVLFFDSSQTYRYDCLAQMAICYEANSQLDQAIESLQLAYYQTSDQEVSLALQFQLIRLFLLNDQALDAQEELFSIEHELSPESQARFTFYSFVTSFQSGQYDQSKTYLLAYLQQYQPQNISQAELLYKELEKINRKNPKTARILSIIMPGLGQFYAGDIKNGLNSLLLNGGLIALSVYVGLQVSVLDALVSVVPWLIRYYQGGYERAPEILLKKQAEKRALVYQQLLNLLENEPNP